MSHFEARKQCKVYFCGSRKGGSAKAEVDGICKGVQCPIWDSEQRLQCIICAFNPDSNPPYHSRVLCAEQAAGGGTPCRSLSREVQAVGVRALGLLGDL